MDSVYLFPYNYEKRGWNYGQGFFLVEKVCVKYGFIILKCVDKWDINLEVQLVRQKIFLG